MNPGATGVFMEKIEKYINCKKEDDQEDLNDRVSRLAVDLNNAYYKEGNHPFEDVHDGFIRSIRSTVRGVRYSAAAGPERSDRCASQREQFGSLS